MKAEKKTLLILTPGFPGHEGESTCLPLQQSLVRAIAQQFPQLNIIVLSLHYPINKSTYEFFGTTVISFGGNDNGGLSRLLLWRKVNKTLNRLSTSENIAGVLSFWCGETALLAKRFATRKDIRHYCWILGQDAKKENKYVKWLNPKPGTLVALSDFVQDQFEANHGIRPEHVIPPGIEPMLFDKHKEHRDIDMLATGSLIPLKQYPVFIESVRELKKSNPALKAVLIGKGPERQKLLTLINRWNLHDTITLAGELPYPEVLKQMQRAKLFLHPSSYEGFGVVNIEALYAGAQVISFTKPMKHHVPNWHVVVDRDEMIKKAADLLKAYKSPEPVLYHTIDDTAKMFLTLFGLDIKQTGIKDTLARRQDIHYSLPGTTNKQTAVIQQNISYYDQIAAEYDDKLDSDCSNFLIREKVAKIVMKTIDKGTVLDFGGGTGKDLSWLGSNGCRVIFCEPSVGMRSKCIQLNSEVLHYANVEFLQGPACDFTTWHQQLPFKQKVNGVLANFSVLNSIPRINVLFQRLSLVTSPGAHLFALVLNSNFKTRWRASRRNAISSVFTGKTVTSNTHYHQSRQTVYLYSLNHIKKVASPYFRFTSQHVFKEDNFVLIHLTRK